MLENLYLENLLLKTLRDINIQMMRIYKNGDFSVSLKSDESPVTRADFLSHDLITSALIDTGIPILSEEGTTIHYNERKSWINYWLIDPLDGTREFINQNGNFTINIALMENNQPVLGVISVPVENKIYIGGSKLGYAKCVIGDNETFLKQNTTSSYQSLAKQKSIRIIASKNNRNSKFDFFINKISIAHINRVGSAIKFMALVENKADLYPRFSPSMEWDTAAADAILRSLGYQIHEISDTYQPTVPLSYNKENLYNPAFIAY